ncbi:MAG: hypothetical protein HXY40_07420 [Chloroflexi bacterium]|nr:hypothetical protein [Chloroflexota bacterium]
MPASTAVQRPPAARVVFSAAFFIVVFITAHRASAPLNTLDFDIPVAAVQRFWQSVRPCHFGFCAAGRYTCAY